MKAIINCGGKGTRLGDVSKDIPKPMVEIKGKPLLLHHILNLKIYGITDIFISVHFKSEKIINFFGNGKKYGVNIIYSIEKELLGTGGAITPFSRYMDDEMLIIYGDVISHLNYNNLLKFHKKNNALATAVIHKANHPHDSDLVIFDEKFVLQKIINKPHKKIPENPFNLAALYLFSPKSKKFLTLEPPFDLEHDLLNFMLERKSKIFCYNTEELIMDIGTPERLKKAKEILNK